MWNSGCIAFQRRGAVRRKRRIRKEGGNENEEKEEDEEGNKGRGGEQESLIATIAYHGLVHTNSRLQKST